MLEKKWEVLLDFMRVGAVKYTVLPARSWEWFCPVQRGRTVWEASVT